MRGQKKRIKSKTRAAQIIEEATFSCYSPLHSLTTGVACSLRERQNMPQNAWDKSFLSGTPAGIDKPGMHLDSPIKWGKWSDIEALYSIVPPLYPLASWAPSTSPDTDFLAYCTVRGMGVAMKTQKRVNVRNGFEVKYVIREVVMLVTGEL